MKLENRRRTLLIAVGMGALTAALPSLAQQKGKVWRIGYLDSGSRQSAQDVGWTPALL